MDGKDVVSAGAGAFGPLKLPNGLEGCFCASKGEPAVDAGVFGPAGLPKGVNDCFSLDGFGGAVDPNGEKDCFAGDFGAD